MFLFSDFTWGNTDSNSNFPFFKGNYRDFDTRWFYDIGAKVTMAMISNSIAPHSKIILEPLVQRILRRWCLDRCCKRHLRKKANMPEAKEADAQEAEVQKEGGEFDDLLFEGADDGDPQQPADQVQNSAEKAPADGVAEGPPEVGEDEVETRKFIFQDQLNRFYTGSKPKLWYYYGWFFTNLMIYFLYGGGMPFMYVLGCLFFSVSYWVSKRSLFTWNQRGFEFNEAVLAMTSVALFKWALLAHLAVTLMIYTNTRLLSPKDYSPEMHYRPAYEPVKQFFERRFRTSSSFVLGLFCIFFIGLYLFWRSILSCLRLVVRLRERQKERLIAEELELAAHHREHHLDHSDDFYRDLAIGGLSSHFFRAHKEFETFRTMINSYTYTDETIMDEELAKFFKKKLKWRIQQIEDTIDIHLN